MKHRLIIFAPIVFTFLMASALWGQEGTQKKQAFNIPEFDGIIAWVKFVID